MCRDVRDLVTDNGGQLVLVLGDAQDAGLDHDLAARHDEGIDIRLVDDRHFPVHRRVLVLQHADDGISDAGDVIDRRAILHERRLLADDLHLPRAFLREDGLGFQCQLRAPGRGRRAGSDCRHQNEH